MSEPGFETLARLQKVDDLLTGGSLAGAAAPRRHDRWMMMHATSVLETCLLNGVDPRAYLERAVERAVLVGDVVLPWDHPA